MIKSIRYLNFKALRDATLPLGPLTLLVGPNGSGKSTALQALRLAAWGESFQLDRIRSLNSTEAPEVRIEWSNSDVTTVRTFVANDSYSGRDESRHGIARLTHEEIQKFLQGARFYAFEPEAIATPVALAPKLQLGPNGAHLALVLDQLRDREPERFENLNNELGSWLPEFDRVLFDTPQQGTREFLLRVAKSQKGIRASELSHGTLFALTLLTLANSAEPPPFVAIEEPDRGVHPRMLRRVQDALYRLSYPEQHGDRRAPVQVVATTHSPFLLDLFRDRPHEIVIAEKKGAEAEFARLVDKANVEELLGEVGLGDLWYSGILGGVPTEV